MAYIDGYVRGEPARIPDNFTRLWPEIYSAEPPHGEVSEEQSREGDEPIPAARNGRKSKEG